MIMMVFFKSHLSPVGVAMELVCYFQIIVTELSAPFSCLSYFIKHRRVGKQVRKWSMTLWENYRS